MSERDLTEEVLAVAGLRELRRSSATNEANAAKVALEG